MPPIVPGYMTQIVPAGRLTLSLGVVDQPYAGAHFINEMNKRRKKGKAFQKNTASSAVTTFDVAKILESKYGIMQAFYNTYEKQIGDAICNSLVGATESLMMRQVVDPFGSGTQFIDQQFRDFISSKKAEQVGIPGTPTGAALAGVNHRLARPYRMRNPRRPSFLDTGLYMASFRSTIS
jgi:hypothetical protein